MIKVKDLQYTVAQIETVVYAYIEIEGDMRMPIRVDRQEVLRQLNMIQDEARVKAEVKNEDKNDRLTEVYLGGETDE